MMTPLNPSDFAVWRDTASHDLPIVLDVREPWEVETSSVKPDGFTLLHIPMQSIPDRIAELKDRHGEDHPIACLCHHGMRSLQVAHFLQQQGYADVVNLQGGIDAWSVSLDPSVARY